MEVFFFFFKSLCNYETLFRVNFFFLHIALKYIIRNDKTLLKTDNTKKIQNFFSNFFSALNIKLFGTFHVPQC